MQQGSCI